MNNYPTEIWVPLRVEWCGTTDRDDDEDEFPYDPDDPDAVYDGTSSRYGAYSRKPLKIKTHLMELLLQHPKMNGSIEIEGTEEELKRFFSYMQAQFARASAGQAAASGLKPGQTAATTFAPIYQESNETITDIIRNAKKGEGEDLTPLQETLLGAFEGFLKVASGDR